MRVLANENFPGEAVEALRARGHDVAWVRTDAPGSKDEHVLARVQAEDRIIITFDKDFGALAFRARLPASSGIILFRLTARSPERVALLAALALAQELDWQGHFAVVEDDRIRIAPLPE